MNSPFDDAKLGREALELKVLACLIDKDILKEEIISQNFDGLPFVNKLGVLS